MYKAVCTNLASHIYIYIYIVLVALILVISLVFISSTLFGASAHALDSTSLKTTVSIRPSLTLGISANNITMNLDPSNNAYDEQDLIVTVATNNQYGYKLYVSNTGSTTDLVNVADNTKTIPNLSSGSYPTAASFPANNWGYRLTPNAASSSGNYSTFTPGVINSSTVAVNNVATALGFGAKIDYETASGLYKLGLEFKALPSVTTNYIQNLDPQLCTEEPLVVMDSRDEQPYTVQRLKDGNCWMMTNLNLQHATDDLTAADTNIAAGTTLSAAKFNGWNKTDTTGSGSRTYVDGELIAVTADNSETGLSVDPTSNTPYATLYNYCAASAGTYCYDSTSGVGDAGQDICPAGWRMPTNTEYNTLIQNSAYDTIDEARTPILDGGLALPLAGVFNATPPTAQTRLSYTWASTSYNAYSVYALAISLSSSTFRTTNYSRYNGSSVRCIRDDRTIAGIQNMQDITSIRVKNTPEGTTATLTDTRDSKTYTVRKIGDYLWMTQNLRFVGTNIEPTMSNVSNTKTFTWYDLVTNGTSGGKCYGTSTSGDGYSYWCKHDSGNNNAGAFYNFVAASAGTVSGVGNVSNAPEDICPKNWKLPNSEAVATLVEGAGDSHLTEFNARNAGQYINGSLQATENGYWWMSGIIPGKPTHMITVNYYSVGDPAYAYPYMRTGGSSSGTRFYGDSIRCVAK